MSTLNVANVTDGTTSVPTGYVVNGSAKAWVNYNGDTNTIQDSINVASITDVANGRHQFSFSNAMNNLNYAVTGNAGHSGYHNVTTKSNAFGTVDASNFTIRVSQTDTSGDDDDAQTSAIVHGDLA